MTWMLGLRKKGKSFLVATMPDRYCVAVLSPWGETQIKRRATALEV